MLTAAVTTAPTLLPRTRWTTHGPVGTLVALASADVLGLAIHWPGTTGPIGDPGERSIVSRLEGYRRFHTAAPPVGRGWADVAYNVAVDQAGRVWDLRGIAYRSAANGTQALNARWVAVLVLLGPGEQPSAKMLDALRWLRSRVVLKRYPGASRVVGHKDIRPDPTACPGPLMTAHIRSGDLVKPWVDPAHPTAPAVKPFALDRVLCRGMTGTRVAALQRRLNELAPDTERRLHRDLRPVRVDGDFCELTEFAVEALQGAHNLLVDGVVGPSTAVRALGWAWVG